MIDFLETAGTGTPSTIDYDLSPGGDRVSVANSIFASDEDYNNGFGEGGTYSASTNHQIHQIENPHSLSFDRVNDWREYAYTFDDNGNRTNWSVIGDFADSSGGATNSDYNNEEVGSSFDYEYNHDNQLIGVSYEERPLTSSTALNDVFDITYRYDVFGRRIGQDIFDADANSTETIRFVYDGQRVIEEWGRNDELTTTSANDLLAEFIYGNYIDDVLQMRRYNIKGNNGERIDYNYLRDDQYSIIALQQIADTPTTSTVVERVRYDAFGAPTFIDPSIGTEYTVSQHGNPYAFQGRRWDGVTRLYHFRARAYDPITGQFLQKDSIGIWGDPMNLGNGYTFEGNMPWSALDPSGKVLIGFEGSNSDIWLRSQRCEDKVYFNSHTRNFLENYEGPTMYFEGPSLESTSASNHIQKSINEAIEFVKEIRSKNPDEPIHVIGFSRGAFAAALFAQQLRDEEGIYTDWAALLDPVDSAWKPYPELEGPLKCRIGLGGPDLDPGWDYAIDNILVIRKLPGGDGWAWWDNYLFNHVDVRDGDGNLFENVRLRHVDGSHGEIGGSRTDGNESNGIPSHLDSLSTLLNDAIRNDIPVSIDYEDDMYEYSDRIFTPYQLEIDLSDHKEDF